MVLVDKRPHAYRTIGEAAKSIGVPAHVLRFWETKFSQIRPMKKGGGRRYYRPEDIEILTGIRLFLYEREFSIKALQTLLRDEGLAAITAINPNEGSASEKPKNTKKELQSTAPDTQLEDTSVKKATKTEIAAKSTSQQESLRLALAKLTGAREKLSSTLEN